MKRFIAMIAVLGLGLALPCQGQKLLQARKANCQAVVPDNWVGTVNFSSNPAEGKAIVAFVRGFEAVDFGKLKEALIASYQPEKTLDNSDRRLWFEYRSAATPAAFDRHWLVIVPGQKQTCSLSLHFASSAEPVVRKIAESLQANR